MCSQALSDLPKEENQGTELGFLNFQFPETLLVHQSLGGVLPQNQNFSTRSSVLPTCPLPAGHVQIADPETRSLQQNVKFVGMNCSNFVASYISQTMTLCKRKQSAPLLSLLRGKQLGSVT